MTPIANAIRIVLRAFLLVVFVGMLGVPSVFAEELAADEQARLAQQFAPLLVFHGAEKYFPVSPLFPIIENPSTADRETKLLRLGTTKSRTAAYLEMTLAEKANLATVHYRAYPATRDGRNVIVLEYWFYYVHDEYRVRSNLLPVWVGGNHPNDLEHIHLILRREESGEFAVDELYASAHEGKIPANRYNYGEVRHDGPTRFLVELGSHAMVPDIDEDGIFTFGIDGHSGSKLQWGIRDQGYTWPRYRSRYMSPRSNGNLVLFGAINAAISPEEREGSGFAKVYPYQLASVSSLGEGFTQLDLTGKELKSTFETPTFWFPRVFGRDNGRSQALLMPGPAKSGGDSVGILGASSLERFLILGTALNVDEPGFLVGARYSFLTHSLIVPDFILETDSIITRHKNYISPQFLISYPFDGFTRIMFGKSLVTDSLSFRSRQWDTVGTIEVRLGDMRISASARSNGPVRAVSKEFRFFYAFR